MPQLAKGGFMRYPDTLQTVPTLVTTTITLTSRDTNVRAANGTYTITLPPVAECQGYLYYIEHAGGGTDSVTVDDLLADGAVLITAQVLNAIGESCLLYSTGTKWIVLQGQTS